MPSSFTLSLQQQEIVTRYLSGARAPQIAAALGIGVSTVYQNLRHPVVKAYLQEQFQELQLRVLEFKFKAVEESETSLNTIIHLRDVATKEDLQRLCAKDIIEIAGLLPRKRVLVESDHRHGIDKDTLEYMQAIAKESGLIHDPELAEDIVDTFAEPISTTNNP